MAFLMRQLIWGLVVINEHDNHDRQRLDSSLVYVGAHNVYYVKCDLSDAKRFSGRRYYFRVPEQLQLREFIDENSGEFFVQVWGNGANFDNTILRRSYERQGIPCPWRYYNDRDVRTIVELGKAIDFDARTAIPFEGERHNALDDARYQAKYVSVIWQKLIPSQADS